LKLFDCNKARLGKENIVVIMVEGIDIIYQINFSFGAIQEIKINSLNYKSFCEILIDSRKSKIIKIGCKGFNSYKVEKVLEECLKEQGFKIS